METGLRQMFAILGQNNLRAEDLAYPSPPEGLDFTDDEWVPGRLVAWRGRSRFYVPRVPDSDEPMPHPWFVVLSTLQAPIYDDVLDDALRAADGAVRREGMSVDEGLDVLKWMLTGKTSAAMGPRVKDAYRAHVSRKFEQWLEDDGMQRRTARQAGSIVRSLTRELGVFPKGRELDVHLSAMEAKAAAKVRWAYSKFRRFCLTQLPGANPEPCTQPRRGAPRRGHAPPPYDVCDAIAKVLEAVPAEVLVRLKRSGFDPNAGALSFGAPGSAYPTWHRLPPEVATAVVRLVAWGKGASDNAPLIPRAPADARPASVAQLQAIASGFPAPDTKPESAPSERG